MRRTALPVALRHLAIDVMPVLERVLGFSNRWYRMARKQSEERELPGGVRIRVVLAPLFIATKMEARTCWRVPRRPRMLVETG